MLPPVQDRNASAAKALVLGTTAGMPQGPKYAPHIAPDKCGLQPRSTASLETTATGRDFALRYQPWCAAFWHGSLINAQCPELVKLCIGAASCKIKVLATFVNREINRFTAWPESMLTRVSP